MLAIERRRHKMSRHNRALRNPQVLRAISVVLCLMCLVPAGASAEKAREATAKPVAPAAAGGSTIYIIRQKEFKVFSFALDIVVDKQKAGELTAGTYLVVRRPPGHHSVVIPGGILSSDLESDLDTVGGRTYFIELGPYGNAPGMQLAQSLTMGGAGLRGTVLPGKGISARFYLLDEKQGAEQIAGLKNVTH
jgi:hypothetical protein